jgi:thiamine biosynthesis lipoprotein
MVALLLVLTAAGCQSPARPEPAPPAAVFPTTSDDTAAFLQKFEYVRPKMGTGFRIVLYAPDKKSADAAVEAAFARIDQLNAILSDYDPKSELSKLSQRTLSGPMTEPVKVSDDLWRVLEQSQIAAERSDGAFDITVGPFVKLWRRSRDMGELPTPERLAEAKKSVGYRFLKLDPQAHTVQLLAPRMRLDVGGIGKGYASGEALAELKKLGITRAAVGAAGDLSVGDPPPGRQGWRVAIQSLPVNVAATQPTTAPTSEPGVTGEAAVAAEESPASPDFGGAYVRLSNYGASTSSDTERFTIINGQRYSHIIDPATGLGMTHRVGVTVIAPDDTTADWMALAVCLMGPEKGIALVDGTPGTAARMVSLDEGRVAVFESKRFKEFLASEVK